ncbi:hypothetical protein OS493_022031 [Desmophyllum pertusum]|uniref:RAWUL domain-containing protein n=1 Tax=Desmophyllum pertusum TaxID=174260 RepID=A0A9W9Z1F9_9CNID|nr:hypothetical protein OS493_022031 [Desmophyllum pertusum]
MCVLCGGYLVDATTIVECLHSYLIALSKKLSSNLCQAFTRMRKGAANEMKDEKEVEMEDPVCITLESTDERGTGWKIRSSRLVYLRCPSAVTVNVLKKFLITKFAIPNTHQAEVIRCDEILDGHLTMREVSRIYGLYAKSFVDLEYAFLEVKAEEAREAS